MLLQLGVLVNLLLHLIKSISSAQLNIYSTQVIQNQSYSNQSAQSLEKHGDLNEAYALKESASARIQKYGQVMYELSVKKQKKTKTCVTHQK